jgi:CubicO group peptidase (beta-lactamase class C family)
MRLRTLLIGSLACGASVALTRKLLATNRSAKPAGNSTSPDAIDGYIEQQMRRLNIPGISLALVEGDQILRIRGFGEARPRGEVPSLQTPFFIGSLTKSFTALAVMQPAEARKIELDAPVQRYLAWFRIADPKASAQMSVRHLLNQTSGLPEWSGEMQLANFDDRANATERQARALASIELSHPVGSACEYSNENYNLLGLIIEAASGETYADYLRDHIFRPLRMGHTYTSRAAAKQNGLAMGHRYWFALPIAAHNLPVPRGSLPSGQLISTAEDLAHYLIAHLNGGRYGHVQILSEAGIEELHRGVAEYSKMGVSAGKYAMGWFADTIGRAPLAWHSGTVPDFGAYMAILPEQKKGIVLLFNAAHHWFNPVLSEVGMGVTALFSGKPYVPVPMVSSIPWMLRGLLLIPALQIGDVISTFGLLNRWRREPETLPCGAPTRASHVLLPLIANLLVALNLRSALGKRRGYLKLFMPDYFWVAMVCGSFSLIWGLLRTGLIIGAQKRNSS